MDKNELNQTKGMTNMVSNESSDRLRDIIESVLTIVGVIAFAVIISLICKKVMVKGSEPELTIGANDAEIKLYNADYDGAISSYESTKDNEEWPMYLVKEAETYSLKGDYTYSNRLLSEAYDKRNGLIRKEGIEKYKKQDAELGKLIMITALMNGEVEKALEYGEIFLLDDGEDEELYKTMFTVYLVNGKSDEAKKVLDELQFDETSAKDLSQEAYMNMVIGKYDKSIACLKDAYEVDKNEIKIYDVLEDIMQYHSKKLIDELKTLNRKNADEECYKVFLARCYSLNGSTVREAEKLLNGLNSSELSNIPYKVIEADIYKNFRNTDEYNKTMEELIENEKDNYYGKYLKAKYDFENKRYSEGIENAKNSIIDNRDYVKTYYVLMPELLYAERESEKSESYIRTALNKEPFNYNILISLADYAGKVKMDAEKALKYYDLAAKIDGDNAEIYYNMAIQKIALDKNGEAEKLLNKAIELDGKQVKYYRKLSNLYLSNKNNDKAIKAIRKAYDINNSDITTLNDAGYYYMVVGEIDRAMTNFKSAYEGINSSTDVTVSEIITKNYEMCKQYSANKGLWTKSAIDDFKYLD